MLASDLIRANLKVATNVKQHFLTRYPDLERALKFQRNPKFCVDRYQGLYKELEKPKKTDANNGVYKNKKSTRLELCHKSDIFDISTNDSSVCPVRNKSAHLLSSGDE